METALDVAFVAVCLAAAGWDLVKRIIPNALNLVILLGAVAAQVALYFGNGEAAPLSHLAHFAIALIAAMLLFRFRLWGGGDGKFYACLAAWFPLAAALPLAVWTALMGGVLVIAVWLYAKVAKLRNWQNTLPYGIAIAAGGLLTRFGPQIF